jgi:threonine dehydratase
MAGKFKPKGRTVVVLSGGNIDPLLMQKVIGHGLVASDRYVTISVMLPDRPGMLVKTAEAVARAHGNVVEVMHTRHGNDFEISEVELKMSIETTGAEHSARVLKELQAAGLKAKVSDN